MNMSRGLALRVLLTLVCLLMPTVLFYTGESGPLGWMWFFLAIGVGLTIGQLWALALAPIPFLLGANLGRFLEGPQPPGYGLYPGYEFSLTMWVTTIIGLVGIGIGFGLHTWIKNNNSWSRIVVASGVIMALAGVWGYGLYRQAYPPPIRCYLDPYDPNSTLCTRGPVPADYVEIPVQDWSDE